MKKILPILFWLGLSPALAQNITCPTRSVGDTTNACASTAFVQNQIGSGVGIVNSVFGRVGTVVSATNDYSFAQISGLLALAQITNGGADTILGNWSGSTAAPTYQTLPTCGANIGLMYSTSTHTWACEPSSDFSGPGSATVNDIVTWGNIGATQLNDSGVLYTSLAPLASPTFTGTPASTTPAAGDNTTRIATTAFVQGSMHLLATYTSGWADSAALTSTYAHYAIRYTDMVPSTNGAGFGIQVKVGGSFVTSSYLNSPFGVRAGASISVTAATTVIQLNSSYTTNTTNNVSSTAANGGVEGQCTFDNPSVGGAYVQFNCFSALLDAGGSMQTLTSAGIYNGGTGAITGIQFVVNTGSISSGTVSIYGWN